MCVIILTERMFNEGLMMDEIKKYNLREQQASETKHKILKAALKHFATHGFHASSVRNIHKSIDVSGNLLYHYFPGGKEELLKVISDDAVSQIEQQINAERLILESMAIDDILEAIYQTINEIFKEHFEEIKLIFIKLEEIDNEAKKELIYMIQLRQKWLPEFLYKRALKNEIKAFDYESATQLNISLLTHHFMVLLTGINQGPLSDDESRRKIFKHLVSLWKGQ